MTSTKLHSLQRNPTAKDVLLGSAEGDLLPLASHAPRDTLLALEWTDSCEASPTLSLPRQDPYGLWLTAASDSDYFS